MVPETTLGNEFTKAFLPLVTGSYQNLMERKLRKDDYLWQKEQELDQYKRRSTWEDEQRLAEEKLNNQLAFDSYKSLLAGGKEGVDPAGNKTLIPYTDVEKGKFLIDLSKAPALQNAYSDYEKRAEKDANVKKAGQAMAKATNILDNPTAENRTEYYNLFAEIGRYDKESQEALKGLQAEYEEDNQFRRVKVTSKGNTMVTEVLRRDMWTGEEKLIELQEEPLTFTRRTSGGGGDNYDPNEGMPIVELTEKARSYMESTLAEIRTKRNLVQNAKPGEDVYIDGQYMKKEQATKYLDGQNLSEKVYRAMPPTAQVAYTTLQEMLEKDYKTNKNVFRVPDWTKVTVPPTQIEKNDKGEEDPNGKREPIPGAKEVAMPTEFYNRIWEEFVSGRIQLADYEAITIMLDARAGTSYSSVKMNPKAKMGRGR